MLTYLNPTPIGAGPHPHPVSMALLYSLGEFAYLAHVLGELPLPPSGPLSALDRATMIPSSTAPLGFSPAPGSTITPIRFSPKLPGIRPARP